MSQDENQTGLGIERQMDAIGKWVADKGWALDPRWSLTETASASVKKKRPRFEQLLQGIRDGEVTTLVVYAADRLTRRLHDFVRLAEAVEDTGCEVHFVTGGDMLTGYSRGMAGVLAGVASMEVQVMSERHKQRVRQSRRLGKVTNGGRRSFGYKTDRKTLVPHEADLLREAYKRLLAGDGLSAIVKDWNRRGIPTAAQKESIRPDAIRRRWETKTLRETLQRPALCGRVVEKQRVRQADGRLVEQVVVVKDDDGSPVVGQWDTVFTPEEFDQLQVVLEARKRMPPGWSSETKHLLTGLLRCQRCDGGTMVSFMQTSGKPTYACRDFKHLSRDEARLDAHVIETVQGRIEDGSVLTVDGWIDPADKQVAEQIGAVEQRKADTIKSLVGGGIDPTTFSAVVAEFDAEVARLRSLQVQEVVEEFEAVQFVEWPSIADMPFRDRRVFIRMCIQRIEVSPTRRGRGFDPESVNVVLWPDLRIRRAWSEKTGEMTLSLVRSYNRT